MGLPFRRPKPAPPPRPEDPGLVGCSFGPAELVRDIERIVDVDPAPDAAATRAALAAAGWSLADAPADHFSRQFEADAAFAHALDPDQYAYSLYFDWRVGFLAVLDACGWRLVRTAGS